MIRTAEISPCGTHRYSLARVWDPTLAPLVFVMLNPSTADAYTDDATIRKCVGFAQRFGYGGILVVNLSSFRARNPKDLHAAGVPFTTENAAAIVDAAHSATLGDGTVVCAWGANARGGHLAPLVLRMLRELPGVKLRALHLLADGTPSHPLMLPYSCALLELPA